MGSSLNGKGSLGGTDDDREELCPSRVLEPNSSTDVVAEEESRASGVESETWRLVLLKTDSLLDKDAD